MASVNLVIIVGHLGKDPETRYLPDGKAITTISVATSESWKDKDSGEKKESTEWHRVTFFGKLAEIASEYLKKGALVYVQGKLNTQKWQDKQGNDRYTTGIIADRLQMLGGKSAPSDGAGPKQEKAAAAKPKTEYKGGGGTSFDDMDSDIPFANPYAGRVWQVV